MSYRILSFDGGGVRGILAARMLGGLVERVPRMLNDVALFAGTSTGALIALGLAHGLGPRAIEHIYREHSATIFSSRGPLDAMTPDELLRAKYDNAGLRVALEQHFGAQTRLGDLRGQVLVPTFRLDRRRAGQPGWAPKIYHNVPTELPWRDQPDLDALVVDVALETSAAPTYLPSYQGAIDGGVFANNPSMCALAKAVNIGTPLANVRLLALGTGALPRHVEGSPDWGLVQWGPKMLDLLMSGVAGVADYQCRQLLWDRYMRIDPVLERDIDLDKAEELDALVDAANETLADHDLMTAVSEWLETKFVQ